MVLQTMRCWKRKLTENLWRESREIVAAPVHLYGLRQTRGLNLVVCLSFSSTRLADRLRRPTLVDDFEETMRLLDRAPPEVFRQKFLARVRRILLHLRQKL